MGLAHSEAQVLYARYLKSGMTLKISVNSIRFRIGIFPIR